MGNEDASSNNLTQLIDYAIEHIKAGEVKRALRELSTAVDITSKQEYPEIQSNSGKMTKFIDTNTDLVLKLASNTQLMIRNKIIFKNVFHDFLNENENRRIYRQDNLSLGDVFYVLIRCSLAHENHLPSLFEFGKEFSFSIGTNPKIKLSNLFLIGLMTAVIISPSNKDLKITNPNQGVILDLCNKTKQLEINYEKYKGMRDQVLKEIDEIEKGIS